MTLVSKRFGMAIVYSISIWLVGFAWGSAVFMIPVIRDVSPVAFVSTNLFISIPIVILWAILAKRLTRRYVAKSVTPRNDAQFLGTCFVSINAILDLFVLVIGFGVGLQYFTFLSVWVAYAVLLIIPIVTVNSKKPQFVK